MFFANKGIAASLSIFLLLGTVHVNALDLSNPTELAQLQALDLMPHVEAQQYLQIESFRKVTGL